MSKKFQVVMDVRDASRQIRFWCEALGYQPEPPPHGFARWSDYWARIGLPEAERADSGDSIVDPTGAGPRIWFQVVDEPKSSKNRLHFDLGASGGFGVPLELRKQRVEAEAERLVRLGATRLEAYDVGGLEHYAVAMLDPEGNEFDIN